MEIINQIIFFAIPVFLFVTFFAGYYYSGFEEIDKSSVEYRSPFIRFLITSGVFITPLLVFIASCYILRIIRGEIKGGWDLEPKEYYENGGFATAMSLAFVIASLLCFIIFFDRKKRSSQAKVFLIIISILFGILSFIEIMVNIDPTHLLK